MKNHKLKIQDCYYESIVNGWKNFEIRKNDRDYQVGDTIEFDVIDVDGNNVHPIRTRKFTIKYLHYGLGLVDGYVVLSIVENEKPITESKLTLQQLKDLRSREVEIEIAKAYR